MKRGVAYGVLALVSYLVFLAFTLPIDRALGFAQDKLKGVYLQEPRGTVWRGRTARLQVADQSFSRVKWQLQALPILWGKLAVEFSFDGEGRTGRGVLGLHADGSLSLSDLKARLPLMEVSHYLNVAPIALTGMADLEFETLAILDKKITEAVGVVRWQGAGASAPVAVELGDFSAVLTSGEDGIQAAIKDDGGPLAVDGVFKLAADGNYHFNGTASVRDAQQRELAQGLRMMGQQDSEGRVVLEYSGKI